MTILIRPANKTEANTIAPLIYDAIGDIANRLTGEQQKVAILHQLAYLVTQTNSRHSYLNTYVATQQQRIVGIVVLYDGKEGKSLDAELQQWLANKNAPTAIIDIEAHEDEYYIDTICVDETTRGLGIGTQLLIFAEQTARDKGYKKLSLNVELEKQAARKLYERMGFVVTEPWTIINEPFHHMVKYLD